MQKHEEQVRTPEEQLRIFREDLEDRGQMIVGGLVATVLVLVVSLVSFAACFLIK